MGLIEAFRRNAWQRTVATTAILYLAIALNSGFKNLHFFAPVLPIPMLLFLMPGRGQRTVAVWRSWTACISTLACLVVCWPAARSTFTLNRQLGQQTTIVADDYLRAVVLARVRYTLKDAGRMSWDCDQHSWVVYSERLDRPARLRAFVLTADGPPAPGYRLLGQRPVEGTSIVAKFYARDEAAAAWLAGQKPLRPLDRYPRVFRPLADGIFSPHNNTLQDVQRLHWPF